jgi:outer membrane putative beta-barrel porin/alpha-amylase
MSMKAMCLVAALTCAVASPAAAQTVSEVLTFLITNQSVNTGNPAQDLAAAQATSDTISRALLANLATLPVTTSSSGFTYRLNSTLGTFERVTPSFGPFFVERALTAGTLQASMGLTFQEMRFTSLDGHALRDGSLVTTANQFVNQSAPFDVNHLTLKIDASVATLYANVGVTDRMEVGFAMPVVALRLDGSRVNTYFGQSYVQATATSRVVGLADVVARVKYILYSDNGTSLGAAVDARLPTGRPEDLLGAGSTSVRFAAIGSLESGPWSTHVNAGVTVGGLAREINYAGALAWATSDRVTVTGELLGRWINSPGGITAVVAPNSTIAGVETTRLLPDTSRLNIVAIMPGVKWNLSGTWVIAANVGVQLTKAGLVSPAIPFIGLDYAFGR